MPMGVAAVLGPMGGLVPWAVRFIARLHDDDLQTGFDQFPRDGASDWPGADDADLCLEHVISRQFTTIEAHATYR